MIEIESPQCLKTNRTGNCVCKLPENHKEPCKCSVCGQEFQGEPSTETMKREQQRSAQRCEGCPLLLSDAEVSIVEKAIGKGTVWMLNKVWEERRNADQYLGLARKAIDMCRKDKKVELEYWLLKEKEIIIIIKFQTDALDAVVKRLSGKIKPPLFNKIIAYVQSVKEELLNDHFRRLREDR